MLTRSRGAESKTKQTRFIPALIASLVISNQSAGSGPGTTYHLAPPVYAGAGSRRSINTGPPPGWYPDHMGKKRERYWDGSVWSNSTR